MDEPLGPSRMTGREHIALMQEAMKACPPALDYEERVKFMFHYVSEWRRVRRQANATMFNG